ncbi:T100 [Tupaiid betaherpesvirus 1]|uniref:T100 n=1 Tax=Tupaiid herpesvirus 1 (strain 1) TaxID=10397 RepID=Q91TK4_TUHV1|nr:T100 [Tupaiid betaherpesvirus 1]AAK57143.1 T100 [Tupaiid betaherpesvirus 1]
MGTSHVDGINLKTWTFSIMCALLTFVNVSVHLIASNYPHLGYPCIYYRIIDFDQLNMSTFNVFHQLTPQLYLDAGQIVAYVTFMQFVFLLILIYYLVCWGKIYFRRDGGHHVNQSSRDIAYMGDSLSCFLYILCMDTFQLFTLTLSFRLPSLVAFTHCLHFISLTVYVVTMLTQYQSYERSSFALTKIHPRLTGTVKFKTAILNMTECALGFATMVFAMSLALGFGNSFFVRTGPVVFGMLSTFTVVAGLYLIVLETVLHRYMKVQFGYHLGLLCGLCGALYPVLKYERVAASTYARSINLFIGLLFAAWVVFALCRAVRFFVARHRRRYRPLQHHDEEIKHLKASSQMPT